VRRGEKEWAQIVQRLDSSGLAGKAFCQREGVALSSLQRWRRRLASRGAASFVELVPPAAAAPALSSGWSLELTLPNGASVRFQG
jgi:transposase-like protein